MWACRPRPQGWSRHSCAACKGGAWHAAHKRACPQCGLNPKILNVSQCVSPLARCARFTRCSSTCACSPRGCLRPAGAPEPGSCPVRDGGLATEAKPLAAVLVFNDPDDWQVPTLAAGSRPCLHAS